MPIIRNAFRIGRSRTGLGAFAKRDLPANRRIAEYKGPMLDKKGAERAENRGNRYLFEIDRDHTIDGTTRANVARYINHSCHPNAEANYVGYRIFIKTTRRISKGEEIVYNYGLSYLKNVIGQSNCKCSRCRRRRARKARAHRAKLTKAAARKTNPRKRRASK
ncbi:MAG: SET domain-containing protein [Pseudolabrys sp.]|nr:SET domain-containing protein [Pseudolabrys sp.]